MYQSVPLHTDPVTSYINPDCPILTHYHQVQQVPTSTDPDPPSTDQYCPLLTQYHYISTSITLYWPRTTKYQPVPPYTDPIPPSTNQYHSKLTHITKNQPVPPHSDTVPPHSDTVPPHTDTVPPYTDPVLSCINQWQPILTWYKKNMSKYSNVRLSFVDLRWAQLYVSLVCSCSSSICTKSLV